MIEISVRQLLEMSIKGKVTDVKKGASGVVYIVDNGENYYPRKVAYKSFQERFSLDEKKKQHFIDECIKWFKLRNPYVVTPFYAEVIGKQPVICMPFCSTDLKSLMISNKFSRAEALVLITQLVKAMISIEQKGFNQHQDLNPPNIMLNDLCENFPTYPKTNMLNYEVNISDFGMIDLYNSLGPSKGAIGGKFPFKAPEQYSLAEREHVGKGQAPYKTFKPDTFALGVIIYMLFTGKHPNGLTAEKALNKNTSSSRFKNWALTHPKVSMDYWVFEEIVNGCLKDDPSERPLLLSIFNLCLEELNKTDKNAYDNLLLRFDEHDKFDLYQPRIAYLQVLENISELPNQRLPVLEFLMADLIQQKQILKIHLTSFTMGVPCILF
jgi:serine/threonine protein kinase